MQEKLLPEELRAELPKLYAQETVETEEKQVSLKFFFPAGNWTWFVTEGELEGDDFVFFGSVVGDFDEWTTFIKQIRKGVLEASQFPASLINRKGTFRELVG